MSKLESLLYIFIVSGVARIRNDSSSENVEQTFQFAQAPPMGVLPSHEQTGKFALHLHHFRGRPHHERLLGFSD
jgi:hypothetical protein